MTVSSPGIAGIRYAFPSEARSVRQLGIAGQLTSDAGLLESFGFAQVHVAVEECAYDLALSASSWLMTDLDVDPENVGLLIYAGTPGTLAFQPAAAEWDTHAALRTTDRFKYPATRLAYELGLTSASVLGLDQLACTTLFGALRIARALCLTEGLDRALCVAADFFPAEAGREAIFNCTSDAACAVLLERVGARNRLAGSAHVTKGYYWDCDALRNEIVASYFPTAKHVIERAIADAGWRPGDVDWVIPHNVSLRSWEILLGLVRLPKARLWSRNIARHGHTLAGDNFINLQDALDDGSVQPGQKLLLFSYGYGAHWTALALEA